MLSKEEAIKFIEYTYDAGVCFTTADDMEELIDKIYESIGSCKECTHYDWQDEKFYPGGSFNWGLCRKDPCVDEDDLRAFFQVGENFYCQDFKKGAK